MYPQVDKMYLSTLQNVSVQFANSICPKSELDNVFVPIEVGSIVDLMQVGFYVAAKFPVGTHTEVCRPPTE